MRGVIFGIIQSMYVMVLRLIDRLKVMIFEDIVGNIGQIKGEYLDIQRGGGIM